MASMNEMLSAVLSGTSHGLLYSTSVMAILLTFQIIRFPDLTVDGSFSLGGALAAICAIQYHNPHLGLVAAFLVAFVAGIGTAALHCWLGINKLLSGILMMGVLYTVCLRGMGQGNLQLGDQPTSLTFLEGLPLASWWMTAFLAVVAFVIWLLLFLVLTSKSGLHLRAMGHNPAFMADLGRDSRVLALFAVGLSNGLVGFNGALVAQSQGFADVGMGMGILIFGLACMYIGGALIRSLSPGWLLLSAVLGSVVYGIVRAVGLNLGLRPTDFKAMTALVVIAALCIRARFGAVVKETDVRI